MVKISCERLCPTKDSERFIGSTATSAAFTTSATAANTTASTTILASTARVSPVDTWVRLVKTLELSRQLLV